MIEDTTSYSLPDTDIIVDVTYMIDGDSVSFQFAEIDGQELNCDLLGLQIDVSEKWDLIRKTRYLSLKQWFQSKLDHDAADLFSYHDVVVESDKDEHYPAGLL